MKRTDETGPNAGGYCSSPRDRHQCRRAPGALGALGALGVLGVLGRMSAALAASVVALTLSAAALAAPPAGAAVQAEVHQGEAHRDALGITFSPCTLTHPTHIVAVEAQCGHLRVPENPDAPAGRQIDLFVARVPAVNLHKRADALFLLAGGPGQAATEFYTQAAGPFARIHRDRDIVLVDQRGTGRSNGLYCRMDDDSLWQASDASLTTETRRCLQSLARHADVAYYTTSLAVRDLDRVRDALGYRTIDLYGESYGTRVALHYLRRFPRRVRAVILDGVVPPQEALGATLPLDAQASLDAIFARCKVDPACHATFGDPGAAYRSIRDALLERPVAVSVPDPTSGRPVRFEFSSLHFAAVLRLASYTSEQAALLPLSLHEAAAHDDFAPLASQFLLVDRTYENAIAAGMHNTVVCTEDVPFYREASIDRARLARTFLGTSQLDALERVCALWPRGPIDPDFHAPIRSATPVMLLSGANDPVTPAANAREVAAGLRNHVLVELSGMGHGQLAAPCIDRLMAEFIEHGAASGLDVSCALRAHPFPFFTSFAGPPP